MPHNSVSIVMAAYNAERFIEKAVLSVLTQSYDDYHLYIVDDGSTDGTLDILSRFSADNRCSVLTQENQGQAHAKNRGALESNGTYIAFLDADDIWTTDKLQIQLPLFENPSVGVSFALTNFIDGDGKQSDRQPANTTKPRGKVTTELFQNNFVPFSSAMIRRSIFENLGGFDESLTMGIDWELWLRASLQCEFDYVETPTLLYRLWTGQMSSNILKRYEASISIMDNFLAANPGAISNTNINRCYSETYANWAFYNWFYGTQRHQSVVYLQKAFRYSFRSKLLWKNGLKILLNRR